MLPTRVYSNALPQFDSLDREFGRMMRRIFGDGSNETTNGGPTASYPVDIREDQNHLYVEAELPGFKKDDVDVTLENGVLSIVAERAQAPEPQEGEKRHLTERSYRRVARSFSVPKSIDENKVDAKIDNGVLYLTLHKKEEVKPRKIEVK